MQLPWHILIVVLCGAGKPGRVWLQQIASLGIANVFHPEGRVYVCTHRHLSPSWNVLGWGLALRSRGSLNQKQSCATQRPDSPIIQTNERRSRAWIIENMDSPQWLSFVCVDTAPGMLMLIIMCGLDRAISEPQIWVQTSHDWMFWLANVFIWNISQRYVRFKFYI